MSASQKPHTDQRDRIFRQFQTEKFDPRHAVPAVSMTVCAEVAALQSVRRSYNAGLPADGRASLTHVLVKAAGVALGDFPELYSAFDGKRVVSSGSIRINLPVAEQNHVEYVVIDSPDRKGVAEIGAEVREEIARIRAGQGTFYHVIRDAMKAPSILRKAVGSIPRVRIRNFNEYYGNFPITNFGSFGVETGIPVVASPAIAVLCVGAVKEGTTLLPLTLVFDHRCVDGARGGAFLGALKGVLEREPATLFELPAARRSA